MGAPLDMWLSRLLAEITRIGPLIGAAVRVLSAATRPTGDTDGDVASQAAHPRCRPGSSAGVDRTPDARPGRLRVAFGLGAQRSFALISPLPFGSMTEWMGSERAGHVWHDWQV